jgi:hypothetical protein
MSTGGELTEFGHFNWRVAVVGLALTAMSAASQANIFVNPGFETGDFTGWTTTGGVVMNLEAHSGLFSFAGFSADSVSQTFAATATSSILQRSFWGKRNGGLFDLVQLTYSDSSHEDVLVNTLGQGNDWTFIDLTAELDAGKSLVGFLIFGTTPGPAFLDDFNLESVRVVAEPSSYALIALALVAMGFTGRRRKA